MRAELDDTPVLQHPGMEKVLIDRGHLVLQHGVEVDDDCRIALHGRLPFVVADNHEEASSAASLLSTTAEFERRRGDRP
jgi:hypothetical protein